jgi:hypothetical protein
VHPLYALTDSDADGRVPVVEQLRRLNTPDEFWQWIANYVPAAEIPRRKSYYAAHFEREKIDPYDHLFWLCHDVYLDIIAEPPENAPVKSKADLDDALAEVTSFKDWPHKLIPTPEDYFDVYSELAGFGIIPPRLALERLKCAVRTEYALAYDLPVFAAPTVN